MSTDISRQRFQPTNDFAAVLMQQGRVLLDADWNEWVEILDRRLRAETIDIIGRGVVPKETPHGFEIALSGANLTIGPGRIYVDGILAENHGANPIEWDPTLAELRGAGAIPYNQQPYLPDMALIDEIPTSGGPHLVYLDVWRRDVTWLENRALVESAVGVDSTTRWQTAWQVRVLPRVGAGATCGSDIPAWESLIRPSAGRLTVDTFNAPTDPDPCHVPPTGAYKGLDNRLYRIEIHSVNSSTGAATFKWARHNASVATTLTNIKGENLIVDLIGRDADLRFHAGDWVEITDDARELVGLPGLMRKIRRVTDATRTIVIEGALPAGSFPTNPDGNTLPERHTRVRRWDQKGQIRSTTGATHHDLNVDEPDETKNGAIPVAPGTALLLEDGIQITISLDVGIPGGRFRPGDYWVFTARVDDASVEKLSAAPPRGIHHHYCRLALVTFPGQVIDCRKFWPPEFGDESCDCTVCVTAESHNNGTLTIQQAIDQVRTTGGTVCLSEGIFNVPDTFVRIDGARSVRMRGQGWRTIIAHTGRGTTLLAGNSLGLALERFTLLTARSAGASPDLFIENSADVSIRGCYFLQIGSTEQIKPAIGLGGVLMHTRIEENVFFSSAGIANAVREENQDVASTRARPLLTLGFHCERNQFLCPRFGVRLRQLSIHLGETMIEGNFVSEAVDGALVLTGAVFAQAWGGSRLDLLRNSLRCAGDGIVLGTDEIRVDGNDIGPASATQSKNGIVLENGLLQQPLNRVQITNNRIQNLEQTGILIQTAIQSGFIKQNQIEGVDGGGIVMDEGSSAESLVIENNQLIGTLSVTAAASEKPLQLAVIHLARVRDLAVINNLIRDAAVQATLARRLAGIQALACGNIRIIGNRVVNLGPAEAQLRDTDAIAILGLFEHAEIVQNSIERQVSPFQFANDNSIWRAVRIGNKAKQTTIGATLLMKFATVEAAFIKDRIFFRDLAAEQVGLRGNTLASYGLAPAVQIVSTGPALISENRARSLGPNRTPVIDASTDAIIFSSNFVQGPRGDLPAVLLQVGKRPFTVLGNITTGPIFIDNNPLPGPWKPLNVENA